MEPLLAVKVGCLVGLLFLTLICGMAPAFINWFLKKSVTVVATYCIKLTTGIYELILCLISSFAAGIFLGACLLHVVADFLSGAAEQLAYINYPMGELILSLGFFFVLLIEHIVLQISQFCQRNTQDGMSMDSIPSSPDDNYQEKVDPPSAISMAPENPHNHVHTQVYSSSSFRSLILFCSLSIHSVFEGLAIGLQSNYSSALQIAIAVLIHKGIIVFSLSTKLIQSMTRPTWLITYIVIFSLMSPIGITIGIIVTLQKTGIVTLVQTILEGIASGTFVYVTFLEILPQELNSGERPLLKVFFIIIGFAVMAVIAIWA